VVAAMRARGFAVPAAMDAAGPQRPFDPAWIPEEVRKVPVREVMTHGALTARETDPLDDARARVAAERGQRLMVVDAEGRTIGAMPA
jgi:CBS-domain-containing membrane protein